MDSPAIGKKRSSVAGERSNECAMRFSGCGNFLFRLNYAELGGRNLSCPIRKIRIIAAAVRSAPGGAR
jgi:hypothetical protein